MYRRGDRVVVWGRHDKEPSSRVGVIEQCRHIRTVKDGYVQREPMCDVRFPTGVQGVSPDRVALVLYADRFYRGQYVRWRTRGTNVSGTVTHVHGDDVGADVSTYTYDVRATDGTVALAMRREKLKPVVAME